VHHWHWDSTGETDEALSLLCRHFLHTRHQARDRDMQAPLPAARVHTEYEGELLPLLPLSGAFRRADWQVCQLLALSASCPKQIFSLAGHTDSLTDTQHTQHTHTRSPQCGQRRQRSWLICTSRSGDASSTRICLLPT